MSTMNEQLQVFLQKAVAQRASDLHLMSGSAPVIRVDGQLYTLSNLPISSESMYQIIQSVVLENRFKDYQHDRQIDFSIGYQNNRVRCNAYYEKGNPCLALRLLPAEIPKLDELGLPEIVRSFADVSQGFMLITGPTGHGKSTTLASLVEYINQTRSEHIITLEDPIEYVFSPKRSIISQREIGSDLITYSDGLRAALREDPNVILVGEMRDLETIEAALTLAETGHLVLSTLHTNSASQTVDRVIDVFPQHKQSQIRIQFANVLLGVVSQRLLPKIEGGRVLVSEVMVANNAIRNLIREGKNHQIPNVIQTSVAEGMISLDRQLASLVSRGVITIDEATAWSLDPKNLQLQLYK